MRFSRFRRESEDAASARVLADLLGLIQEHGWAVRHVMADPAGDEVCFSYTIGLIALGHPEVIILGMPPDPAQRFLNQIGDEVRSGSRYQHGTVTEDFTDDASVMFIRVERTGPLSAVDQVYGRVEAVQMIWPDSAGRMPWQDGYRNPPGVQPFLGPLPGA